MRQRIPFHSNAVWPSLFAMAMFAFVYVLFYSAVWLIIRLSAAPNVGSGIPIPTEELIPLLVLAAISYAIFRLVRFHPAFNIRYAAWMRNVPWTPDKPLPLGPIFLVWQDAAILSILCFLAWRAHFDFTIPLIAFAILYVLGLHIALLVSHTWTHAFLMGFLWPSFFVTNGNGIAIFCIFAALYAVAWLGVRRSLRAFPWKRNEPDVLRDLPADNKKSLLTIEIRLSDNQLSTQTLNLGWPFYALSPKPLFSSIRTATSLFISLLVGWWVYCATAGMDILLNSALIMLFAVIASFIRTIMYCVGLCTPFNVWGRLATGRFIVPGFDRVFITPLTVIGVAIACNIAISDMHIWSHATGACTVGFLLFMELAGGPTMRNWRLTGQFRHRPITLRPYQRRSFRLG